MTFRPILEATDPDCVATLPKREACVSALPVRAISSPAGGEHHVTTRPPWFSSIPSIPALVPLLLLAMPPRAWSEPRPAEEPSGDGPALTFDAFSGGDRDRWLRLGKFRAGWERRRLTIESRDDPELLFFFAEAFAERHASLEREGRVLDRKILAAAPAARPALQQQRQALAQRTRTCLLEAIKLYSSVVKKVPSYERMDEALLRLGVFLAAANEEAKARDIVSRFFMDYPHSKLLPLLYLSLAEVSFEKADLRNAIDLYEKVTEIPDSDVYHFAVYKMGWCHLKLGEGQAALETFAALARITDDGAAAEKVGDVTGDERQASAKRSREHQRLALAKEARKDLVRAYAVAGAPRQDALAFFQKLGGDEDAPKMKQALDELHQKEGAGLTAPPVERPEPRPAADQTAAGPGLSFAALSGRNLRVMDRLTDRAPRFLIAEADRNKPETLFRLAELYAEKRRYYHERGQAREAEEWGRKAVEAYTAAALDPLYERRDEVLLGLGNLLASAKEGERAREVFARLFKDHPRSKKLPEMYLHLAELSFDDGEMSEALDLYQRIAMFPRSEVYPFAVYKIGWCHLRRQEGQDALGTFVALARMTEGGTGDRKSDSRRRALAQEAHKGIVAAYVGAGAAPGAARAFFGKVGGDQAAKMTRLLAELYRKQGRTDAADALLESAVPATEDHGVNQR